jgi:hypothetical protein
MGQTLAVLGVIIIIVALAIHYVIKGLTLFVHASLIIGIIGVVIAVLGAAMVMMRSRAAK